MNIDLLLLLAFGVFVGAAFVAIGATVIGRAVLRIEWLMMSVCVGAAGAGGMYLIAWPTP